MKIINSWDINSELKLCHIEKFDNSFNDLVKKHFDHNYPILRWREHLSERESQVVSDLNKKLKSRERIDICILKDEEIIGWSYGWQGGIETANYYMANSCVVPEYRRQGLYTLMLKKVLEISKELGFQTLTSRHVVANNDVIIPKLKTGFHITSMELSELHGNLVHLTYFHNELRRNTYVVRSGLAKPEHEAIKSLYN